MHTNERKHWTALTLDSDTTKETPSFVLDDETAALARQWQDRFMQSVNLDEYLRMEPTTRRAQIENKLNELMHASHEQLPYSQYNRIVTYILNEALGYGPLNGLVGDPSISEIMVNGPSTIYVERNGQIERIDDVKFQNDEHLRNIIDRVVSRVGRRVDEASPMVDARLADGSRVNALIPPLALDGSILTIRKFQRQAFDLDRLAAYGSLTDDMADFLKACVRAKLSILVSGGTGTGKTTLLNSLAACIPAGERVVTVEDSAELKFHQQHPHVVRMETRPPNVQGAGAVAIRDLVKNALRMRPDRIVVGEVRGAEALDMLQAMNTGHEGSMTTLHANSSIDALRRTETMVLWAEGASSLPMSAIREQIVSAVDLIVQLTRYPNGRKITAISEVQEMRHGEIIVRDIFRFDVFETEPTTGNVFGRFDATGVEPTKLARLEAHGETGLRELFISRQVETELGVLLVDDSVTEIMINGINETYVERSGGDGPELADLSFHSEAHLLSIINSIIAPLGRQLDPRNPTVDARLMDGSRVNAVIPPVSGKGPILTIRRFPKVPLRMTHLQNGGALSREMADFLRCCVEAKFNMLISGGTGSGKTTLLNALSTYIHDDDRIITIEDVAELQLQQDHWLQLEARPVDEFGEGQVTIRDLVINTLRMRPDRIIVGEVRGAETLDMLQAMNTGHAGSMTTIHANSPDDAFYRLATMVSWGGNELPSHTVRAQIVGALDIIVQPGRVQTKNGLRRVIKSIAEVRKDRDVMVADEIFAFRTEVDPEDGLVIGGEHVCVNPNPAVLTRLKLAGRVPDVAVFHQDNNKPEESTRSDSAHSDNTAGDSKE